MSKTSDQRGSKQDGTFLCSFMVVLGVISTIASFFAFFSGGSGFVTGLFGLAIAGVFFALGRMLDYLHEIRERLARLESRPETKSDKV
ncbi:MAG: hypothetical protein WCQ21_01855 [Verrucomicrobiota bacterium]|jgi:hypothetical protein